MPILRFVWFADAFKGDEHCDQPDFMSIILAADYK